jgi:hypothetical protein
MADLKKRMHFINILLDKWLKEEKLSNEELGEKVRQWYYQNENRVEHWLIDEGNIPYEQERGYVRGDVESYGDHPGLGDDEIYL